MITDPRAWAAALRNSHDRLAGLVGPLTAEELTQPSYAKEWTVAQVLSHLGSGAEIGQLSLTACLDGSGAVDREKFGPIWDAWNAKSPQQQAADCLAADEAHISRIEGLPDDDLARMKLEFFGMQLDAVGVIRLRLGEHAVHTWDVAVVLDPAATVSPDAAGLLVHNAPFVARFAGKPAGETFQARLRAADSDADFLLEVGPESVSLTPWAGAAASAGGEIALPAEALLRLVYGRLDPASTPAVEVAGSADLDQLRAVFPGF